MKKIIVILAMLGILTSCETGVNRDTIPLGNHTIQTLQFEGCEYVYIRRYGAISITHKGNCKNHLK